MADEPVSDPAPGDDTPLTRAEARRAAEASSFQDHVRTAREELEQQFGRARDELGQVNERINARSGRNLLMATLIGLAIGVVVVGTLLWIKWLFLVFAIPVCLLGLFEFSRALQAGGRRVDVWPQLVVGTLIMVAAFFEGHWTHWVITFAGIAALIVWRLIAQMAARDGRRYGDVLADVLVAGFVPLYVPFLASLLLVLLRQDEGQYWVLTMIVTTVAVDTGAYAAGVTLGKHPMAPRISPKKTWEGFGGATLAAVIAATLMSVFMLHLPIWAGILFGLLILASATIGDLGESMIKRDLGIKDMSSWLPGHGGVLDRLDSILPSAAVALGAFFLFSPLAVS